MKRNNYRSIKFAAVVAAAWLAGPAWAGDPTAAAESAATADEMEEVIVVGSKTGKRHKRVRPVVGTRPKPGRPRWQFFPEYEPAPAGHRLVVRPRDHFERRESITVFRLSFGR